MNDEYILSLQDDVQSATAESPPSFKPPPPPGVQRRPSRRDQLNKCPSSESSHSGLYFTAPTSHNHSKVPGHTPASPSLHHKREHPKDVSRDYAAVRKRDPSVPSKKEQMTAAQLAMVTQHNIGPFPRVQSPSRGTKPVAPSPSPPPPPPLPAPLPPPTLPLKPMSMSKVSSAGSKPQFVTVEVHRPNAEPDVNEVRPLPQARGEEHQSSLNTRTICLKGLTVVTDDLKLIPCPYSTATDSYFESLILLENVFKVNLLL